MPISLHIDRLILHDISLSPSQRPVLQAAMQAELGRLLAEGGVGAAWQLGGAVPSVTAPQIQLSPKGTPTQWGHQIAHAVYQGISP